MEPIDKQKLEALQLLLEIVTDTEEDQEESYDDEDTKGETFEEAAYAAEDKDCITTVPLKATIESIIARGLLYYDAKETVLAPKELVKLAQLRILMDPID